MPHIKRKNQKGSHECSLGRSPGGSPGRSPIYYKCINSLIQFREKDNRLDTGDFNNGQGLNPPPKTKYCYANQILDADTEVVECFKNKTTNRLCLVNAFQTATQNNYLHAPPKWCLFDPKTGRRLYEIATDIDGNKVLCVVDECNARKQLANINPIDYRKYGCLTDDKGKFWTLERRDILGPTQVKKRLSVQESCHGKCLPETSQFCCCEKQKRNLIYEQRRGHCLSKTRYACGQPPTVNRIF